MPEHVQDFGQYSVKNVKIFQGREGYGFNCNLYRGTKKIAFCLDDASGGETRIEWANYPKNSSSENEEGWREWREWVAEETRLLKAHLSTLTPIDMPPLDPIPINEDIFIEDLVNQKEEEKELRRKCRTLTLYKLNVDGEESSWVLGLRFDNAVRARLQLEHGENLVEIINERFL